MCRLGRRLKPSPMDVLGLFFFFNDTATTEIYTLSLHDALPISIGNVAGRPRGRNVTTAGDCLDGGEFDKRRPVTAEEIHVSIDLAARKMRGRVDKEEDCV